MTGKIKLFMVLLRKNFLIRKRHWILSLFVQIVLPISLMLIGEINGLIPTERAKFISHNTYHDIQTEQELIDVVPLNLKLRYTPSNSITDEIMELTRQCLGLNSDRISISSSEENMISDIHRDKINEQNTISSVGIVFQSIFNNKTLPKLFKYKLRISSSAPSMLFGPDENGNVAEDEFGQESTVQIPMCLDKAYIKLVQPNPRYETKISIQQMPYPPYLQANRVISTSAYTFTSLMRLGLLVILCAEITFPGNEKYIGVNILMSVNGITYFLNILSWFVTGIIWCMGYLLPSVLILKYFLPPTVIPFLLYSDAFLIFLTFFFHACHLFAFGYHFSSYFWKPSNGVAMTVVFLTIIHIFRNFLRGPVAQRFLLYFGITTPTFILDRIFYEIAADENRLSGLQWSNLFTTAQDSLVEGSIGVMIIFSIIGFLLHFSLAIYINAIYPGKYGVPQHPFYYFQKNANNKVNDDKYAINFDYRQSHNKEFEYVAPGSLEPSVRIRNLKKTYTNNWFEKTQVIAVRNVSMDIYKNQITALLGHNGAGKTTMMSILSGLTNSTEGVVFINGKNILNQTNDNNKNIGLCPQENMLFPSLTVYQQLFLFGMMKANNKTNSQLQSDVNLLLAKVNLMDKRNAYPSQLSGGQKRRLCLALAIIGDSEVLILDEPTSGMDAESKREVWNILLKMRNEKTIIISTHDMEEADILGDRIAIMHTGQLRSYGTSMFLKKLYGNGKIEVTLSIESWCEVSKIAEEIGITPDILKQDDSKIIMALPPSQSLPEALDRLENSKKKLGITGLSVSIITLEQVFLHVTEGESEHNTNNDIITYEKITGIPYYVQTFYGFFIKKITYARKNPLNFWISLIFPCLSVVFTLLQFTQHPDLNHPYSISLANYPDSIAFVHADRSLLANMYIDTIQKYGGSAITVDPKINVTDTLLNYGRNDVKSYRNKVIVSAEFNNTSNGDVYANGLYSGSAYLGIPLTINCITNTIVKALTNDEEYRILMLAEALPDMKALNNLQEESSVMVMSLILFLAPAISFYIIQPLTEVLSGVKQLQTMTGAPKSMYWAANFVFDFLQYIFSILLLLAISIFVDKLFDMHLYYSTEIYIITSLLILFGISALSLVYASTFFKRSITATRTIFAVTPVILVLVEMILLFVSYTVDNQIFKFFRQIQSKIFLLLPHMSFTYGYLSFFSILMKNARCRRMPNQFAEIACINEDECCLMECFNNTCAHPLPYFFEQNFMPTLKESLICLALSSVFYFGIIFILEQQYFSNIMKNICGNRTISDSLEIDEMVKKEKLIINEEIEKRLRGINNKHHINGNVFLVRGLKKNYGNLHAVKGIDFRVKQGECFGLLGVNGAGKSTTFKMLTGEIIPNAGTVYLKRYNITSDRTDYLAAMGYCPQHDALIDTLNSWDHLYLFARLRGVPSSQVSLIVKRWVKKLNLTACAFQPSGTYSGGNKRRLNIAMALIGNPSLVLMDEPTTGVDPAARRSLWNILKNCQTAGQSIIFTSHSMEECETLCNRLVIMVNGRIVCVGACEQLKQRFSAGYNIHIKLLPNRTDDDVEAIKQHIMSKLNCNLVDQNIGFISYHITDSNTTWTIMYALMDELKSEYNCIEDYVVLSSTLEQLFLQFARRSCNDNDDGNYSNGIDNMTNNWWKEENILTPV